jgi:hypothetical protein
VGFALSVKEVSLSKSRSQLEKSSYRYFSGISAMASWSQA